jgi:hypothetical protein
MYSVASLPKTSQIDNFSRRYYEKELGAGVGPSPSLKEHFGYTEPFRRFVQHETFAPQANEIPNTAASWLPGDDYYTNFHEGDPFIKVDPKDLVGATPGLFILPDQKHLTRPRARSELDQRLMTHDPRFVTHDS